MTVKPSGKIISFHKLTGKWQATARLPGDARFQYVGVFPTREEAEQSADLFLATRGEKGARRRGELISVRLRNSFLPEPNSGCWLWTGTVDRDGYGRVGVSGKSVEAHRAMYELEVGEIIEGMHVCHSCDVRCCVNPEHLWLGTNQQNNADKISKGRQAKGERNGTAKLTTEKVREIRASRKSNNALSQEYGVVPSVIQAIRSGKLWRQVQL